MIDKYLSLFVTAMISKCFANCNRRSRQAELTVLFTAELNEFLYLRQKHRSLKTCAQTEDKYKSINHTDWTQHQPSTQVFSKFRFAQTQLMLQIQLIFQTQFMLQISMQNTFTATPSGRDIWRERERERERVMATDKIPQIC